MELTRQTDRIKNINLIPIFLWIAIFKELIIPFGKEIPLIKISFSLIFFLFAMKSLIIDYRFNYKKMLLISLLFAVSFYNFSYNLIIYSTFTAIIVLSFDKEYKMNKYHAYILYFVMSVAIIYWSFNSSSDEFRVTINGPDPNFSGAKILMFFFFCDKMDFKLGKILSFIMMFLIASRNLLLAIFIFYLIRFLKPKIGIILRKIQSFSLLIFLFLLLIFVVSLLFIEFSSVSRTKEDRVGRITSVSDTSNLLRFYNNFITFDKIINDPETLLWGLKDQYHDFFVYINPLHYYPHNSLLSLLSEVGLLFFILYIAILSKVISKAFTYKNYEYLYSFLFFISFLHDFLKGILFLFFLSIFFISKKDRSHNMLQHLIFKYKQIQRNNACRSITT